MAAFTLLDDGRPITTEARVDGEAVHVPAATLAPLGWELHDGLLCNDTVCIPAGDEPGFTTADGIDLATLARLWRLRPVPGQRIVLQPIVTLRPKRGIRMELESR